MGLINSLETNRDSVSTRDYLSILQDSIDEKISMMEMLKEKYSLFNSGWSSSRTSWTRWRSWRSGGRGARTRTTCSCSMICTDYYFNYSPMNPQYPFLAFFQAQPLAALELARTDDELAAHETIQKYQAHFYFNTFRILRDFTLSSFFLMLATKAAHTRRSLALSAPLNRWSGPLKYIVVPGLLAWYWEYRRYQEMMSDLEDLNDE